MQPEPRVWIGEDSILRVAFPQDFHLTLDAMHYTHQQRMLLAPEKRPLLVYADSVAAAEYDAQQYASNIDVVERVSAAAIIVKSVFTRAMGDMFMRFHKPPYPTRVFNREDAAIKWLRETCPEFFAVYAGRGEGS